LSENDRRSLCDLAYYGGVAFIVLAVVLAVLTFVFPAGKGVSLWTVLLRNLTTVVAMLILGKFLRMWAVVYSGMFPIVKIMKSYKRITILVAVASAVKMIVSFVYALILLLEANLTGIYYAGEVIVWGALMVFFINYASKLVADSEFLEREVSQDE